MACVWGYQSCKIQTRWLRKSEQKNCRKAGRTLMGCTPRAYFSYPKTVKWSLSAALRRIFGWPFWHQEDSRAYRLEVLLAGYTPFRLNCNYHLCVDYEGIGLRSSSKAADELVDELCKSHDCREPLAQAWRSKSLPAGILSLCAWIWLLINLMPAWVIVCLSLKAQTPALRSPSRY